jgi:hypothetical protein
MPHCKVCFLTSEHPGVWLDKDSVCNLCKLEVATEFLHNIKYANEVYEEFRTSGANPRGPYDCLLMFSGGKDSTYLLDKFVNEEKRRVVAYTFDVPFESDHAAENLRLVREKIPVPFVLDKDDDNIKKVVREAFNRPAPEKPGKYLDEKMPCMSCRTFFVIRAIIYAYRNAIPYVVFCADPQQIMTIDSNVREILKGFYRSFGEEFTDTQLKSDVEEMLFAEDDCLPKIVFPFIAMRSDYDPDKIVEKLKAKGLYNSSPLETHCTLFPLLNYYSFSHWGCMFYKLNASSYVRAVKRSKESARTTYSIKFPRSVNILEIEEKLKKLLFEIAAGEGNPREQEEMLIVLFTQLDATEEAARFVARTCLNMRETAAEIGIQLS